LLSDNAIREVLTGLVSDPPVDFPILLPVGALIVAIGDLPIEHKSDIRAWGIVAGCLERLVGPGGTRYMLIPAGLL
jgi:hypothetical protein